MYTVSFKTIQSIFFSKWRLLIFSGGNHPLTRHLWRLTRTPPPVGTPIFFIKMTAKWCTLDYLYSLGHFLFSLRVTGKNSQGGQTPLGDTQLSFWYRCAAPAIFNRNPARYYSIIFRAPVHWINSMVWHDNRMLLFYIRNWFALFRWAFKSD